ncbi:hypothetical protein BD779DRAFT_1607324 [Infundibulicybe gibba]|nr:hypothetical protein BD779DRAFT_1607324 [Infundibulicybe gibba]
MTWLSCLLLGIIASCLSINAVDVSGSIQWNEICSDTNALGPSKVILDDGRMSGGIRSDGKFVIPDIPDGTYILSVVTHNILFEQLRIDVLNASLTPEIRPYIAGTPLNPPSEILLSYPVTLVPKEKHIYFIPPESFNLVAMLSNPMMLMMIFGGGMMFAMPYLMKNMDPESLEEFKGQQAKMAGIQNAVASGDLKSGLNTLLRTDDEPPPVIENSTPPTRGTAGNKTKTNKNKRR